MLTTEKFIKRTVIRVIIIVIITTFLTSFLNVANTLVSNALALGQMENSDTMFALMKMYTGAIRPTVLGILIVVIGYNILSIAYNTYKFIKQKQGEE